MVPTSKSVERTSSPQKIGLFAAKGFFNRIDPSQTVDVIGDYQNLGKSTFFGPVAQTDKMRFRTYGRIWHGFQGLAARRVR